MPDLNPQAFLQLQAKLQAAEAEKQAAEAEKARLAEIVKLYQSRIMKFESQGMDINTEAVIDTCAEKPLAVSPDPSTDHLEESKGPSKTSMKNSCKEDEQTLLGPDKTSLKTRNGSEDEDKENIAANSQSMRSEKDSAPLQEKGTLSESFL